jgi:dTDP-4-dehydrorhamnose reductase
MKFEENKILVVGGDGQLGTALRTLIPAAKFIDKDDFDMTDDSSYKKIDWTHYSAILNVAAYTNVDGAETAEGRRLAWQINAEAVAKLARVSNEHNLILFHVSSDYVFDGTLDNHTEDEPFTPLGVYGQTKAAGDIAASTCSRHYIVRTSWVVGNGKNFVRTMNDLAKKKVEPSVVGDQIGRLTFTDDLAGAMVFLLENEAPFGTYNFSNDGESASWAEIASEIFRLSGGDPKSVTAVTTKEYFAGKEGIAPRPRHSTLDLRKIKSLGLEVRPWKEVLERYIKEQL